ncbi:MAG: HTTM domain-containing protein, partial [Myxococcota bacterium]
MTDGPAPAQGAPHPPQGASLDGLHHRAWVPVDIASLAMFRIMYGALMLLATLRFLANGWVERFFVQPTFTFKYWGFGWVELLSPPLMHAAFAVMALAAFAVMVGLFYRVAMVTFVVVFTYVELLDVTNYLNHYVLVSLLGFLMCFLPMNRAWSLDVRWGLASKRETVPAWMVWLLRFQVAMVYIYAGLAKTGTDWLIHAQPMNIWMTARVDTPIIGPWLQLWPVALAMSWAGFLYDSTIVGFLLWRRTRALAYVAVIGFHTMTGMLFTIGMFPVIMITVTPIFFDPDWPRRILPKSWITALEPPGRTTVWRTTPMQKRGIMA